MKLFLITLVVLLAGIFGSSLHIGDFNKFKSSMGERPMSVHPGLMAFEDEVMNKIATFTSES